MLGIFQTKKRENNELILKSLVFGGKTTNQIGEYIYFNRKAIVKPNKVNKNEVKKIVSIISRKRGRLKELETKRYIEHKDNSWGLTGKGFGVSLTLLNSISEISPYIKMEDLTKVLDRLHEIPIVHDLLNNKVVEEVEKIATSPLFLQYMKDCTNELIIEGLDLDKMSVKEFNMILMGKIVYLMLGELSTQKSGQREVRKQNE